MADKQGWDFQEGDEIVPGRHAVRLLGGGLRYEAYLAWDEALYALVAIKVLRPDLATDARTVDGLAGEAYALGSLAHPALVRAFAVDLDCDRPHVVLEYLDGPRLSTLSRRHGIIPEQLLPLALQLCSAIHYMHAAGWLHLDVKPRNIIMAGPPRLIDLSIARTLDDGARIDGPVGTRLYMSPEQCDPGRYGEIGPAADVWGIGITLYEALTGASPFAGMRAADREGRYPQLGNVPRPPSEQIPGEFADPLMACLADRPEERPSAAELGDALAPLVDNLPPPRLGLFRPGGRRRFQRLR